MAIINLKDLPGRCPQCGARAQTKDFVEECGLAGKGATLEEMLKVCIQPSMLRDTDKFPESPCITCIHGSLVEYPGTFIEIIKKSVNGETVYTEKHCCWKCGNEFEIQN